MNISPVSSNASYRPVETESDYLMTSSRRPISPNARLNDLIFHSDTDHPFSDAYIGKITNSKTPIAERVSLGLMIPIMAPITAILDVIFYPWIKLGQFVDWAKDKLS